MPIVVSFIEPRLWNWNSFAYMEDNSYLFYHFDEVDDNDDEDERRWDKLRILYSFEIIFLSIAIIFLWGFTRFYLKA